MPPPPLHRSSYPPNAQESTTHTFTFPTVKWHSFPMIAAVLWSQAMMQTPTSSVKHKYGSLHVYSRCRHNLVTSSVYMMTSSTWSNGLCLHHQPPEWCHPHSVPTPPPPTHITRVRPMRAHLTMPLPLFPSLHSYLVSHKHEGVEWSEDGVLLPFLTTHPRIPLPITSLQCDLKLLLLSHSYMDIMQGFSIPLPSPPHPSHFFPL